MAEHCWVREGPKRSRRPVKRKWGLESSRKIRTKYRCYNCGMLMFIGLNGDKLFSGDENFCDANLLVSEMVLRMKSKTHVIILDEFANES